MTHDDHTNSAPATTAAQHPGFRTLTDVLTIETDRAREVQELIAASERTGDYRVEDECRADLDTDRGDDLDTVLALAVEAGELLARVLGDPGEVEALAGLSCGGVDRVVEAMTLLGRARATVPLMRAHIATDGVGDPHFGGHDDEGDDLNAGLDDPGSPTARADRNVLDRLAIGLGCPEEWSGADDLEWIADVLGEVRPHPGGSETGRAYLRAFEAHTRRAPDRAALDAAGFDVDGDDDEDQDEHGEGA